MVFNKKLVAGNGFFITTEEKAVWKNIICELGKTLKIKPHIGLEPGELHSIKMVNKG